MMMRAQTASSLDDKARRALVYAAPATKVPRHCVRASVARSNCDTAMIAPISNKLRAIASAL